MRVKKEKCSFFLPSVEYLGHTISAEGLNPTHDSSADDKVRALVDAPRPENISQLRSFLGMINYYG